MSNNSFLNTLYGACDSITNKGCENGGSNVSCYDGSELYPSIGSFGDAFMYFDFNGSYCAASYTGTLNCNLW